MNERWRSGVVSAAVLAASVFTAGAASANGRFPRAEHLLEDPSNHDRLTIAATYGVLTTDNGGASWYYTCEQAFSLIPSPPGYLGDPELALMPSGALLAGVQTRLTMSEDRACGWRSVLESPKMFIGDFAVAPSNRNIVIAVTRTFIGNGVTQTQLQQSTDGGHTWKVVGTPLPIVLDYTVDVDPKNPDHVYVTGVTNMNGSDTGVLLDSSDLGATWVSRRIPNTSLDVAPYIARVHPSDPSKIFVRTDEWTDGMIANDALLYTEDAGATWTELLRPRGEETGAKLFAFALSPDGSTVLAGYGDPVEGGGRNVDRTIMGLYKSSGPQYSFGPNPVPLLVESVSCLEWTTNGVYVCGAPDGKVSYLAFAKDIAQVTSSGLTTIMRVDEIRGEPPCCQGSSVSACNWLEDCQRLGACADGGSDEADASCASDGGPNPGRPDAGAAAGSGGAAGSSGGGSSGSGGSTAGTAGSDKDSTATCQCDLGSRRGTRTGYVLWLALASLAITARRRSRVC